MSSYEGKASLVFSSGDSFAECRLVAATEGDGWAGEVTDILFRTQMVPTPLNPQEHLRLDDAEGKPIVSVKVVGQDGDAARVEGEGDPFTS
jgi:hypothetical protein